LIDEDFRVYILELVKDFGRKKLGMTSPLRRRVETCPH
jgi:hypothetical protein